MLTLASLPGGTLSLNGNSASPYDNRTAILADQTCGVSASAQWVSLVAQANRLQLNASYVTIFIASNVRYGDTWESKA